MIVESDDGHNHDCFCLQTAMNLLYLALIGHGLSVTSLFISLGIFFYFKYVRKKHTTHNLIYVTRRHFCRTYGFRKKLPLLNFWTLICSFLHRSRLQYAFLYMRLGSPLMSTGLETQCKTLYNIIFLQCAVVYT